MVNVLEDIVSRGADQSKITVVCVVACPPALQKLSEKFPGKLSCIHAAPGGKGAGGEGGGGGRGGR